MMAADPGLRFRRIAAAGIFFQGGAVVIDTGTIVAALINAPTGSAFAIGAAAAIARYDWLFPHFRTASDGSQHDQIPVRFHRAMRAVGYRLRLDPDEQTA